jgi:chorismate dehydratase
VQLIDAVPARCAALLAQGAVGAALVPVIEYQRTTDVLLVPDICVGSQSEVRSVVLVSLRDDLKEIRSVALDESSRTSATLIKILFREFVGHEPVWESYSPDLRRMLNANDGALIIGDPAMTFDRARLNVWDLASLWREFTGLGFVFAMWMVRAGMRESLRAIDFPGACDEGLSQLDQIAKEYASSLSLPASELELYLRQNISFRMDASMRAGLDLYYDLAWRHNLIDAVKPLKTLEP